uniref:Uncharacterized protein n=1 Tax=Tetranychus urticae TaxID=32264 RepID=T1JQ81_TETUR
MATATSSWMILVMPYVLYHRNNNYNSWLVTSCSIIIPCSSHQTPNQ